MDDFEDIVDNFLFEEGLSAMESDEQCWCAELARTSGCRAASECTSGFVRGKNHLKNKICDACRRHGVFVRVDRVWVLADSVHDEFTNKHGAGLWTSMPAHPSLGFRLINQCKGKCKGPRMLVCNCELPPALTSSCTAPDDALVVHGRWVHLRVRNGTLVPTAAAEFMRSPEPLWQEAAAAQCEGSDGSGCEHGDQGTKRARVPESADASSLEAAAYPSFPMLSWSPEGAARGDTREGTLSHPPAALETAGAVTAPSPPLDSLLAAHVEFAVRLSRPDLGPVSA